MVVRALVIISLAVLLQSSAAPKVILFFGDSLTAGYGLSQEEAFPALIGKKLDKSGKPAKVVNAGLSGETSAGGLSRIDWILRQPVDVFVLELGANDGLRGLPLDQTQKNLQSIIDKVRAKNPSVKIVLAGMMVPPNMGADYTSKFKKIYPELAKKNSLVLIPFLLQDVAGKEELNQADGIHPNTEGHKIVANNVFKILDPLI
jgi:acyl-CoA thioesterase-1